MKVVVTVPESYRTFTMSPPAYARPLADVLHFAQSLEQSVSYQLS